MRAGFKEFVEKVLGEGGRVGIMSVNWSREWIGAVLEGVGVGVGHGDGRGGGITVMANRISAVTGEVMGPPATLGWLIPAQDCVSDELGSGSEAGVDGRVERKRRSLDWLSTARSKLQALKILHLRSKDSSLSPTQPATTSSSTSPPQLQPNNSIGTRTPTRLIYIADSPTDLDCLLVAELPIIMLSPSTEPLKKQLLDMGYEWKSVGEIREGWGGKMDERMARGLERERVVFWAREFAELLQGRVVFGGG